MEVKELQTKSKGRFWIENELIDNGYLKSLKGSKLNILLVLARHYNKQGYAYPSIRRIAKFTGLHHTTIKNKLLALEKLGLISITCLKEGYKVRYFFTKLALEHFIDPSIPLVIPDRKYSSNNEVKKYTVLENNNFFGIDPDGDKVFLIDGKPRVKRKNGEFYDYTGDLKKLIR